MFPPPPESSLQHRRALRSELRQRRRELTPDQQTRAALRLALRLARHPWLQQARSVAGYLPADGEISPLPLLKHLWSSKQVYLPCVNAKSKAMHFKRYECDTRFSRNAFGIAEPRYGEAYGAGELDVVLLPLVGFDSRGNRLGMGGGFYDRALAQIKRTRTRLIGLAHSIQEVEQLPAAAWDIPLHAVATDNQVLTFARR